MARKRRPTGVAIGGILAGLDSQLVRATKPRAELVEGAKPAPTITGSDGSRLSIGVPPPDVAAEPADDPAGEARQPTGPMATDRRIG